MNQIEGSMLTPGNMGDSKAAGLYGLLITMWYLLKDNLMTGTLMVACNGDQC